MILFAAQTAGRLGGGGAVDVPIVRIVLAFLFCALVAFLAILLIRQRTGRSDLSSWLRQATSRTGEIDVVEVRRLTMHADVGLVRHGNREYLLVVQAGSCRVLENRKLEADALTQT